MYIHIFILIIPQIRIIYDKIKFFNSGKLYKLLIYNAKYL